MNYLKHVCESKDCQWLDSRVYSPSLVNGGMFEVVFQNSMGVCRGFATWMPDGDCKKGSWIDFTLNFHSMVRKIENEQVLRWRQNVAIEENRPDYKYWGVVK